LKVQSAPVEALAQILAPFQFFLGREMMPKSIRFSFGGSKSRGGELGPKRLAFHKTKVILVPLEHRGF
jgi:hypothetical protein